MDTPNLNIRIDATKLRAARGGRPLGEVASKLGISNQYLSMIELGNRRIPSNVLVKLLILYGKHNICEFITSDEKNLAMA